MTDTNEIVKYVKQNSRNKIVFCHEDIDGIRFVNVGFILSQLLNDEGNFENGYQLLSNSILNRTQYNELIGDYIAIENIGILFEPELKLDLCNILEYFSHNQCFIIKSEAEIRDDKYYFLIREDLATITLSGLSYKLIQ
jgi:hypothetical protein